MPRMIRLQACSDCGCSVTGRPPTAGHSGQPLLKFHVASRGLKRGRGRYCTFSTTSLHSPRRTDMGWVDKQMGSGSMAARNRREEGKRKFDGEESKATKQKVREKGEERHVKAKEETEGSFDKLLQRKCDLRNRVEGLEGAMKNRRGKMKFS
eukprot:763182-Hanusia_phi.AAC.8